MLLSGTGDYYEFKWLAPDKKVFVLQDKLYDNKGKFYIDLGMGSQELSDFQNTSIFHLDAGYYFASEWGVEVFFNYYKNKNNSSYDAVQGGTTKVLPFILRINQAMGAMAIYSPFYAKLNTYNLIYYIDWSFGAGLSLLKSEDNYDDFSAGNTAPTQGYKDVSKTALTAKTQLKFHLNENFTLNIDYVNYWAKTIQPNGGKEKYIRFADLIFGLGMQF
jgi:outer membrane beta-barrel protein